MTAADPPDGVHQGCGVGAVLVLGIDKKHVVGQDRPSRKPAMGYRFQIIASGFDKRRDGQAVAESGRVIAGEDHRAAPRDAFQVFWPSPDSEPGGIAMSHEDRLRLQSIRGPSHHAVHGV